jgi:YnbE-like lipoprotein
MMYRNRKQIAALAMVAVAVPLGGCVQVTAPDRPIEIVLNINIRQEVVYRLDGDARALIQQNSEIF